MTPDVEEATATHEAGHAIMRWVVGLPCTRVVLGTDGDGNEGGYSVGTGRRIEDSTFLLVAMAGLAAEHGYGLGVSVDWGQSDTSDINQVCISMRHSRHGPRTYSFLEYWFRQACDRLLPYADLVDWVAERLIIERELSGRSVAALCREFRNRHQLFART